MKHLAAKFLAWAQFAIVLLAQASNGHFPQNLKEWATLLSSAFLAAAVHKAASTDGTR